ncbi:hypothetical protein HPB47_009974 [Ixodes persulcatus]|uniref:Uncharacterized protein n=1 Tax=Ixodes persulcatus TaxID=34615 RepID=A0AC60P0G7_IXOPE|nr:hypothetical protein HPB47_009974 [Ixodes persulcatus]
MDASQLNEIELYMLRYSDSMGLVPYAVCAIMKNGTFSLIAPTTATSYATLASYANTFRMPFVSPAFPQVTDLRPALYGISLRPRYLPAIVEVIRHYRWKSILYLYDSDDARTATHSEREQDDASLVSWTERLVCDKNTYTETINLTTETPEVNRHLLHLWEARQGLIKRWKRQKLNRKLKKRISAIVAEALETTTQEVLALDVKRTFDNVGLQLILRNMTLTNCGSRMYNYLRDFPRNRTATIGAGDLRTDAISTPNKGTPQGAVLSPNLFNLAMSGLPPILERIPHIKHSL